MFGRSSTYNAAPFSSGHGSPFIINGMSCSMSREDLSTSNPVELLGPPNLSEYGCSRETSNALQLYLGY